MNYIYIPILNLNLKMIFKDTFTFLLLPSLPMTKNAFQDQILQRSEKILAMKNVHLVIKINEPNNENTLKIVRSAVLNGDKVTPDLCH